MDLESSLVIMDSFENRKEREESIKKTLGEKKRARTRDTEMREMKVSDNENTRNIEERDRRKKNTTKRSQS